MSLKNCFQLRSDAILEMLIQLGFYADDIDIEFNGDFRKKYTSGVETITINDNNVAITFNENSIYDLLPEGLFHQSRGNAHNQNSSNYIDEHKRYKREAKAARKFFNPLDQVLLFSKADARLKKDAVLQELINEELQFVCKMWHLDAYLNNQYLEEFLPFLKQLNKYKAKPKSIAQIMAHLFNCKTSWKPEYSTVQDLDEQEEIYLGFNSCLQANNRECILQWHFVFSDINNEIIVDFFKHKDAAQILHLINHFFMPIDIEVQFSFEMSENIALGKSILGAFTI